MPSHKPKGASGVLLADRLESLCSSKALRLPELSSRALCFPPPFSQYARTVIELVLLNQNKKVEPRPGTVDGQNNQTLGVGGPPRAPDVNVFYGVGRNWVTVRNKSTPDAKIQKLENVDIWGVGVLSLASRQEGFDCFVHLLSHVAGSYVQG